MRYRFLRFPGGKRKAVTLSYDDGVIEDLKLADILTSYGMKGTFNFVSNRLREVNLPDEEIKTYILDNGHEIAIHGALHRAEGILRPIDCRLELEERFNMIVRGMAYPDSGIRFCTSNTSYEKIKGYLEDLDIVYARTLGGDNNSFRLPGDWYSWMPTAHHNNPKLWEYVDEFINLECSEKTYCSRRYPILFYLWGHSNEFERDNNWNVIDEFCKKMSGNEGIWYATNIEIYEYVNAYNSLVFNASETKVYNPTLYDIWFDADKVLYKISPGEILNIK